MKCPKCVRNQKFGIPVLHYTQLLGLAMEFSPDELGFKELRMYATKLLNQLGL